MLGYALNVIKGELAGCKSPDSCRTRSSFNKVHLRTIRVFEHNPNGRYNNLDVVAFQETGDLRNVAIVNCQAPNTNGLLGDAQRLCDNVNAYSR